MVGGQQQSRCPGTKRLRSRPGAPAGPGRFQLLLVLYTSLYLIADSAESMLIIFIAPAAECLWGVTSGQASLISSAAFLGMFVGYYGALSLSLSFFLSFFVCFSYGA